MEMITAEILAAYDLAGLKGDARSILTNILMQADFVKFAKAIPLRNENELSLTYSRQFIETTKPVASATETKLTENTTIQVPDPDVKA
jgi:hypothetical protein